MGCKPDFTEPVMLSVARGGATVGAFCTQLHADLAKQLQCAPLVALNSGC